MSTRLDRVFTNAKTAGRGTLGIFITAGDPDLETTSLLMDALVQSGADFIELGMPFSDPMADGPAIQAASLRALKSGMTLAKTLELACSFRQRHPDVPLILMGYYNPIYIYGNKRFLADAVDAGVDGLIIVDLPPEEDDELCIPAKEVNLNFIRLVTPTSDDSRLPVILDKASGFVYYVSVTGITGTSSAGSNAIGKAVEQIRKYTKLPIVTGFGIRTPEQASQAALHSDGAIVGSAVVDIIAENIPSSVSKIELTHRKLIAKKVNLFVNELSRAIRKKVG